MGENISNDISTEITHPIYSKKSRILPGRFSSKVVQRIVKFQILDFAIFIVVVVVVVVVANMEPNRSKGFERHIP